MSDEFDFSQKTRDRKSRKKVTRMPHKSQRVVTASSNRGKILILLVFLDVGDKSAVTALAISKSILVNSEMTCANIAGCAWNQCTHKIFATSQIPP